MPNLLSKLLKSFMVVAVVAPAGIAPAAAACCGPCHKAHRDSSSYENYNTSVTNTSMQMTVTENATFAPIAAPSEHVQGSSGGEGGEEVM